MLLISNVMIFGGIISPKLPFSRHTGLRLPWTVRDEETWNLAHQIIGYISLPLALLYLAATWTITNFEIVTGVAMLTWIGIPGLISYIFFWKKMHGKLLSHSNLCKSCFLAALFFSLRAMGAL